MSFHEQNQNKLEGLRGRAEVLTNQYREIQEYAENTTPETFRNSPFSHVWRNLNTLLLMLFDEEDEEYALAMFDNITQAIESLETYFSSLSQNPQFRDAEIRKGYYPGLLGGEVFRARDYISQCISRLRAEKEVAA